MRTLALVLVLAATGCTDGMAPDQGTSPRFAIAPAVGISGNEAVALSAAFNRIDNFVVTVLDRPGGRTLAEASFDVTPAVQSHRLDLVVPDESLGSLLTLTISGREGSVELFRGDAQVTFENATTGADVAVTMRYAGPGIRGSVTDEAGLPASGVAVGLFMNRGMEAESVTAADGSFLFIDVDPGQYQLIPVAPDQRTVCPGGRDVDVSSSNLAVAVGFVLQPGSCTWRALVMSGGDLDDTDAAAAELAGDPTLSVDRFFFVSTLPTLGFLTQYDVVVLYQNGLFDESTLLGSRLAEYVAEGGNVVFGSFYWQGRGDSGQGSAGWASLEGVDPFASLGGATYQFGVSGTVLAHPLTTGFQGVASNGLWGGVAALTETSVVATWEDGTPLVGYRVLPGGQRMVGVSLFPASLGAASGDTDILWTNAARWAAEAGGPKREPGGN